MTAIQLSKSWSINPNIRNSFTTLVDMAGWYIYENHAWLKAHGWTVKYTCDGTTGPSSAADHTDRLLSKANGTTRGASAAAAQSFSVLTSADGVDLMFTYQGASDDVIRISYSPNGLFVPAGTTTNQPTATDEVVFCQASSVVNGTASADRVMTIWAADDGRNWSCALFRAGTLQFVLGLERINSACAPGVFSPPYMAHKYAATNRQTGDGSGSPTSPRSTFQAAAGAAAWRGGLVRVVTGGVARVVCCGAGVILLAGTPGNTPAENGVFLSNTPALQAGTMPLFPLYLSAERVAGADGYVGTPQDWWVGYSANVSVPATADLFPGFDVGDDPDVDPVRTNWFVALGSAMIRPWKNVAASLQTT